MRILLVRLRPIGDVVFTTPLLGALRRRYPDAHLTYRVEPDSAPILDGNPHIDDLFIVPRDHGWSRLRHDVAIARRLSRGKYDIAVDLHGGPRSAWFTWASRAPTRIGYTIAGRTWMYTHAVARAKQLTPRHSVANQWDLLVPLGIPHGDQASDPVSMPADPEADARVAARLAAAGVGPGHALIVIHVSASNRFKRWPEEAFVSLVVAILRRDPSRRVFLTSGPSDADGASRIAAAVRAEPGDLSGGLLEPGTLPLRELRALIARAAVYIGGDSGPLHVAATTAVPIVELLGPTLAERSHPWRDPRSFTEVIDIGPLPCRPCHQRRCEPGDFRCLTRISPDRVLTAAERAIRASAGSTGRGAPERPERPERT
jgi:lipopolysaccharide heptosyltransferase II